LEGYHSDVFEEDAGTVGVCVEEAEGDAGVWAEDLGVIGGDQVSQFSERGVLPIQTSDPTHTKRK
jgi:hypothetical protein